MVVVVEKQERVKITEVHGTRECQCHSETHYFEQRIPAKSMSLKILRGFDLWLVKCRSAKPRDAED